MKSNESFELNRLALVSNELDKVAPKKLLSSLVGQKYSPEKEICLCQLQ